MLLRSSKILFAFVAPCFVFLPATSLADTFVVPLNKDISFASLATNDDIRILIEDESSYCCQISSSSALGNQMVFSSLTTSGEDPDSPSSRGLSSPPVGSVNATSDRNLRRCFRYLETRSDDKNGSGFGIFTVAVANGSPTNLNVRCDETTLFGGFNTSVTDFNFLEVTNTLPDTDFNSESINVRIVARGISGNVVLSTSFDLSSGKRRDVDIHTSAPNDFGPVRVTHNGPKGSIKVTNVQYRIVTQSPLDFEPVLSVPFETRP